jgi:DNA-binding CsgD family transcriptional regulator/tetratricopeptide (TPR) repeat protein
VFGSLDDGRFVGRRHELLALRSVVAAAVDGDPAGVLIAGEAGIGKTRLVRELLKDLPAAEALVLRAQCVDLGDPGLPYLAVVDLVRAARAEAQSYPEVAAVIDRFPVLTRLGDPDDTAALPADDSRRLRIFDATSTLLGELGRIRGPVVLVIEDLQWVDSSSAEFLRFLLTRMTSERLVVLATVRTDGLAARPRARQLVGELARLPHVERLDLRPLTDSEVAELIEGMGADPAVAVQVQRRTGGNPYYVRALGAAGMETDPVDGSVPRALADLLVARVDALSQGARAVVHAAAVVGHAVPDRQLRTVVGLSEDAVDEALAEAVADGLLKAEGSGFAFQHDLVRRAVYHDLLPRDRARWHAAHAVALEAGTGGPAHPAEIAHHYTEAGVPPKLLEWSIRAADEATRALAPDAALGHLERALEVWPTVEDAAVLAGGSRGRVAARAARAAGLAGEPARSVEWAHRAVELCDRDQDLPGAVSARVELVRRLVEMDKADQAVGPAEQAVQLARSADLGADARALAEGALARALVGARRTSEARPQAERALLAAQETGAPGLEVDALATAAFVDEIHGDREGAIHRLRAALVLARTEGDLASELRAHYSLASLHYYNGDLAGALAVLRAAMARVTESGLRWSGPGIELRLLHAIALYASGDLDASIRVTQAPESPPPDVAAARLAAVSCYPAVALGVPDAEPRLAALRQSWHVDPQVALVAGGCEADHLAWQGDHVAAVEVAGQAQQHLDDVAGEGMYGGLWLSALALAALADHASLCRMRRDDPGVETAERQGEVLLDRVGRIVVGGRGRPGDLGPEGRAWHQRALAEHARLQGRPAVELWEASLDAFGYGHVYEQARSRWRLAEALVSVGDRGAAKSHAEAAAAAAASMHAEPLRRAVASTITGARLSGSAGGSDSVLTGREREVLALVAEGLTNRDIGKRLFISEKTASVHLSNLMAKLNVSSRTEAVTVAHRRGLLDVGRG